MAEFLKHFHQKEEVFLGEFADFARVAANILGGEWDPNYQCDDAVRRNQQYFLSTGELTQLIFDSAAVYYDQNGFSSALIVLRSSKRIVTVRVRKDANNLIAEKLVDRLSDAL